MNDKKQDETQLPENKTENILHSSRENRIRPVHALSPEVARKIAAGEVIDRPAAVIRELIDNSIDSGATRIITEISGGGIEHIRVTDNGSGMTAEDIAVCTDTHTTSKITTENDLLSLFTLGFRGEALSSIRAVSRLEITTTRNGREAWKLEYGKIIPARLSAGTIVQADGLFENFPARRQFLKRPAAETGLCRQIFVEKALAWPEIEFRLLVDGTPKLILPQTDSLKERCLAALTPREPENFFYEIAGSGQGFSFSAVIGSPDVIRQDRRQLMVFINGRRIMEYSLLQAMEYGGEGHFPNGGHPFGCLFVTIDPSLVDFNIHPAKREARFRDPAPLHHAVSAAIRDFYRHYTIASLIREKPDAVQELTNDDSWQTRSSENPPSRHSGGYRYTESHTSGSVAYREPTYRPQNFQSALIDDPHGYTDKPSGYTQQQHSPETSIIDTDISIEANDHGIPDIPQDFRFLGQILGTFIAVEKDDCLYLIDQHAAHERILYNELMAHSSVKQELLVPYRIEAISDEQNRQLADMQTKLAEAGFSIENEGDGIWQVTAVPSRWSGSQKDLLDVLLDTSLEPEKLISHIYATAACRAACKDGDVLDALTARNLAEKTFALPEPVCPHGRPVWIIIDRDELFRRIKRT